MLNSKEKLWNNFKLIHRDSYTYKVRKQQIMKIGLKE